MIPELDSTDAKLFYDLWIPLLDRKPQIPPRPKQENRAHVHEPGQNIRIDQSEV